VALSIPIWWSAVALGMTAAAKSLVLSQDGQSWKAERVAEERKP
jgi:hypothetical protein